MNTQSCHLEARKQMFSEKLEMFLWNHDTGGNRVPVLLLPSCLIAKPKSTSVTLILWPGLAEMTQGHLRVPYPCWWATELAMVPSDFVSFSCLFPLHSDRLPSKTAKDNTAMLLGFKLHAWSLCMLRHFWCFTLHARCRDKYCPIQCLFVAWFVVFLCVCKCIFWFMCDENKFFSGDCRIPPVQENVSPKGSVLYFAVFQHVAVCRAGAADWSENIFVQEVRHTVLRTGQLTGQVLLLSQENATIKLDIELDRECSTHLWHTSMMLGDRIPAQSKVSCPWAFGLGQWPSILVLRNTARPCVWARRQRSRGSRSLASRICQCSFARISRRPSRSPRSARTAPQTSPTCNNLEAVHLKKREDLKEFLTSKLYVCTESNTQFSRIFRWDKTLESSQLSQTHSLAHWMIHLIFAWNILSQMQKVLRLVGPHESVGMLCTKLVHTTDMV